MWVRCMASTSQPVEYLWYTTFLTEHWKDRAVFLFHALYLLECECHVHPVQPTAGIIGRY